MSNKYKNFFKGIKDTSPLMIPVVPFGIIFGVLAIDLGLTPLTTIGRLVAGTLMFVGLGLIATVTAIVSAKFISNYVDHHTNDDVLEKLEELEAEIEKLKSLEQDELEKLDELDSEIQDIKNKF